MDIEAGTRRKKLVTEPTLPIYLKVKNDRKHTPPCMHVAQPKSFVSKRRRAWQFAEVKYRVAGKGSPREILGGISGSASPGEVLALMGPSGSGKTTLLSILGGRAAAGGAVDGCISYNDEPFSKSLKRR